MTNGRSHPSPPFLLFRQLCLLMGVAGILASRYPLSGMLLAFLSPVVAMPRRLPHILLPSLLLCFALGAGYAHLREPQPPPLPAWLSDVSSARIDAHGEYRRKPPLRLQARVESVAPLEDGRLRVILEDIRPADASGEIYAGRLVWTWADPTRMLLRGETIEADLRPVAIHDMANPGTWSVEEFWRARNVYFRAWSKGDAAKVRPGRHSSPALPSLWRERLRVRFLHALPRLPQAEAARAPQAADPAQSVLSVDPAHSIRSAKIIPTRAPAFSPGTAVLPALIFGDRSFLRQEQIDLFARAALSHSLALSGLHLSYMAAFGFAFAYAAGKAAPSLLLRLPRPKLTMLAALPLSALYLWLGQAPLSLQRAFLMLIFWTLLLFMNRPKALSDGLFAALAVILLIDPTALFELSLQLSALSVAAIALILPWARTIAHRPPATFLSDDSFRTAHTRHKPTRIRRLLRAGLIMLLISFGIQIVLAPLTVRAFGTTGLWFPLNLLWLPVLGVWVMPAAFAGLAFAAAGLEAPASFCLHLAALPGDWLFSLLADLKARELLIAPLLPRPHPLSAAGYWLLCLAVPMLVVGAGSRRKAAILCLCGLLLFALPATRQYREREDTGSAGVRLSMLDVGQGQSLLLEWNGICASEEEAPAHRLEGTAPAGAPLPAGTPAGARFHRLEGTTSGVLGTHIFGEASACFSGRALIDGGGFTSTGFDPGKSILAPLLTDNAPPRLEAVINTHPDVDHLGGLLYLLEKFRVGLYVHNGDAPMPEKGRSLTALLEKRRIPSMIAGRGDRLILAPGLELEVLHPPLRNDPAARGGGTAPERTGPMPPGRRESGNNASLALRLIWRGEPLAFMSGDLEGPAIDGIMRRYPAGGPSPEPPAAPLRAAALIVPHHGSKQSFANGFYEAVAPAVALVSCGYDNAWGFPSAAVRNGLARLGIPLLSTAEHGRIRLIWDHPAAPPRVVTARPRPGAFSL